MPLAAIFRKVVQPAMSKGEMEAIRNVSDLKIASLINTAFNVVTPDYLEVPAHATHGLAIEFIQIVSLNTPCSLQLRLQRTGEPDEVVTLSLVPVGRDIFVQFPTTLFIDRNVRTIFEVIGLLAGDDYSIFASVFRWRPATLSS